MNITHPCLRTDLTIVERNQDGTSTYVVKDSVSGAFFRFGTTEMTVMRALDGRRTTQEIGAALAVIGVRVSAETLEHFVNELAACRLLSLPLAARCERQMIHIRDTMGPLTRSRVFRGELVRMRWSFGSPDALLERMVPRIRRILAPGWLAVALAAFTVCMLLAVGQVHTFSAAVNATYAPSNLTVTRAFTLWLTAAMIILIHELGHGIACKYFGGEVPELGFMLLYFQPAFYCNVNDAWSFSERRARLWVSAAGTLAELAAVGVATAVWLVAAPGTVAANVALAAMVFSGATAILGNLNPLLPLDGYFALADWLEIPNLRQRAMAHLGWWMKRRVLRLEVPEPGATPRERRVFLTYAALAALYTSLLLGFVAMLTLGWLHRVAGGLGVIAFVIAGLIAARTAIARWFRSGLSTFSAWRRAPRRGAWPRLLLTLSGGIALCSLLPWTVTTGGEFVVRPTMSVLISAPDSGIVDEVMVAEGAIVEAGTPVVRLVDRALEREWLIASRLVDSSAVAEAAARSAGRTADAERIAADRAVLVARAAAIERRLDHLTVRASIGGSVVTARPADLLGKRISAGDSLVEIASRDSVEVRVLLGGAGITMVSPGQVVHLVSHGDVFGPWTGRVARLSSSGTTAHRVEARVQRVAASDWLPGMTGEAAIELRRSSVLGALWWKARQLVRSDLWL